jgi:hypothetical protein
MVVAVLIAAAPYLFLNFTAVTAALRQITLESSARRRSKISFIGSAAAAAARLSVLATIIKNLSVLLALLAGVHHINGTISSARCRARAGTFRELIDAAILRARL